jgi:Ku70/Ku80-like protein
VAPRAYWKGYLKLSLVSCPIALYPAASEREKISFHQLNKKTDNRIRYRKVDAESGHEVESSDIIKGYEVAKGEYVELEVGYSPQPLTPVASLATTRCNKRSPARPSVGLFVWRWARKGDTLTWSHIDEPAGVFDIVHPSRIGIWRLE